ncbi:MAG: glycosyltransferase family 4 protein [Treponema sp.]|nr:glycosyltransferase family 4 protein [Treponema sp.]
MRNIFNKKSICFILPSFSDIPCGGYKVVYEYSQEFYKHGYKVYILYIDFLKPFYKWEKVSFFIKFKYLVKRILRYNQKNKWYKLEKGIVELTAPVLSHFWLPKSYNFCATAVDTSYFLDKVNISHSRKFYLIQDFEFWGTSEEYAFNSYKLKLNKIAISPWLCKKLDEVNEQYSYIPNGFNFSYFKLITPIKNRNPHSVALLYHVDDRKRFTDALEALTLVRQNDPLLSVKLFGAFPPPENLPDWITFYLKPNENIHNMILNTSSIFIVSSKAEGFCLPGGEALICGCALACTDCGGINVYAHNTTTALISPVCDPNALSKNILKLINDDSLRIRIATEGNKIIRQFTWEKAYNLFSDFILKHNNE